jgi:hypothetical protein
MLLLLPALAALAMVLAQPVTPLVQSVDLTVPAPPVYFRQASAAQLVYELHLTNFQQADVSLASVALHDQHGTVMARFADEELRRRLTRPGLRNDHATPERLAPGTRAILHVWIPVPSATGFAQSVSHTVELDVLRPDGPTRVSVRGGVTNTVFTPVPELAPPLRGGPWITIYDPLLKGGHRTAVYTLDGRARIPGRFAIDFIALPQDGSLPPKPAPDANGFGADVLAVADGTVSIAVDGVSDQTPSPMSLEQAAGNHVAIDIGDGRFVFYEHLRQGSVRARSGDRVTRGQVIGQLGSSGSSSIGPHLHFHVGDAGSTLAAEGMPFVFRQFTQVGRFASLTAMISGERWLPGSVAETRRLERPEPMTVVHFP